MFLYKYLYKLYLYKLYLYKLYLLYLIGFKKEDSTD
jgi:hypothetical protein